MSDKTGGPAFPRPIGEMKDYGAGQWSSAQTGMTLRDYFAAKAMQGYIACPHTDPSLGPAEIAEWSYKFADAMLAERSKP